MKREETSETLRPLKRTTRILFENLLEALPEHPDRSIAEFTFTANCVAPDIMASDRTYNDNDVDNRPGAALA
ncbi:hypothetical protein FBU30_008357 [Linnemannia zychae]|nr:hypothetical protein FBU30_008357 [Linnemannia zychae]